MDALITVLGKVHGLPMMSKMKGFASMTGQSGSSLDASLADLPVLDHKAALELAKLIQASSGM